jgi:hypothetical protein
MLTSITHLVSPSVIAPLGQPATHAPHKRQSSVIRYGIPRFPLATCGLGPLSGVRAFRVDLLADQAHLL